MTYSRAGRRDRRQALPRYPVTLADPTDAIILIFLALPCPDTRITEAESGKGRGRTRRSRVSWLPSSRLQRHWRPPSAQASLLPWASEREARKNRLRLCLCQGKAKLRGIGSKENYQFMLENSRDPGDPGVCQRGNSVNVTHSLLLLFACLRCRQSDKGVCLRDGINIVWTNRLLEKQVASSRFLKHQDEAQGEVRLCIPYIVT